MRGLPSQVKGAGLKKKSEGLTKNTEKIET
jgi:hypothetical protein